MKPSDALSNVETFLARYVSFTEPDHAFAAALWASMTYLWPSFDALPYLVITSATKRAGKTRLSEVLQFVSYNPASFTGMTVAALYQTIAAKSPTIFIDEAEHLSGDAASQERAILNSSYRKGASVSRGSMSGETTEYSAYCPKVFVLIGDVNDTLRDRSIVLRLRRGSPQDRFLYSAAQSEGHTLGQSLKAVLDVLRTQIVDLYHSNPRLDFLDDRDEEIWSPLFAICAIVAPERVEHLKQVAVDLMMEKTTDVRTFRTLKNAEADEQDNEYAQKLLEDLFMVMQSSDANFLFSADAAQLLRELPASPWRKFRSEGLQPHNIADLLSRFGVKPTLIRKGASKSKDSRVARGYRAADIARAWTEL